MYFMAKFLRLEKWKRFRFQGHDSITNPNPIIISFAKITNLNPNIWDSEEKIRIRIRSWIFVCRISIGHLSLLTIFDRQWSPILFMFMTNYLNLDISHFPSKQWSLYHPLFPLSILGLLPLPALPSQHDPLSLMKCESRGGFQFLKSSPRLGSQCLLHSKVHLFLKPS